MCGMLLRSGVALAALAAVVWFGSVRADTKDASGFKPLFNGKNFEGWSFVLAKKDADPMMTWSIKDGVIICTGKPNGYFYTNKSYKDYEFVYDWMYARPAKLTDDAKFPGNSGALMHMQPPYKVWPKCVEVQGENRNHGKLFFLQVKGKDAKYDKAAKDKAVKPVGEWNTTEITCKADGTITAKINGVPVSSGQSDLTEGNIGFQSEGAEIHFKNLKIKQMK
jgi:Domain of Unknown Function (DUF1080)